MRLALALLLLFCLTTEAQGTKPTKAKRTKKKSAKKVKQAKKKKPKAKPKPKLPQIGNSIVGSKIKAVKAVKTPKKVRRRRQVPMPRQVVRPHRKFIPRNRIVFVLDVSGSMYGGPLKKAVDACLLFSSDELQVAVITFADKPVRWAGVKDPCRHRKTVKHGRKCLPPAWARLPKHYPEVSGWIGGFTGGGGTEPIPALKSAMSLRRSGLMIVFVSDGIFNVDDNGCVKAVKKMRKWRRKKKLDWVPIVVFGIGYNAKNQSSLKKLAKVGGGGFYVHGKQ